MINKDTLDKFYDYQHARVDQALEENHDRLTAAKSNLATLPTSENFQKLVAQLERDKEGLRQTKNYLIDTRNSFFLAGSKKYKMLLDPSEQSPAMIAQCIKLINDIRAFESIDFVKPAKTGAAAPKIIKSVI